MDIRFVDKNSGGMEEVKQLYSEAFEDTAVFTSYFFEKEVPEDATHILGGYADGRLAAMMFLRDKTLVCGDEVLDGCYIYGVATAEKYRGRGYMGSLLKYAADYCMGQGRQIIYLIPVDERIYRRHGFITVRMGGRTAVEEAADTGNNVDVGDYDIFEYRESGAAEMSGTIKEISAFARSIAMSRRVLEPYRDELYFMHRLWQAEAENAGIYVIRRRGERADTADDISAVVITGADESGDVCIAEVICGGVENELRYAAMLVRRYPHIMPYIRRYTIMMYDGWKEAGEIGINDEV